MNLASKLGIAALAATLTAGLTVPASSASGVPLARKATYKATLKANATNVEAGTKLVLSGKVKPATKGGAVILQKRIADSKQWSKEAKLKMSKKGTFTYTDKPKTPGVRYYRVVVPKAGAVKAGKSKAVKVSVMRWRSLTETPFRQAVGTTVAWSGASIAGKPYAPAVAPAPGAIQGTADWNLDPSCTTLRVRLGNGDQSDVGARAVLTLDGGPGAFSYTHSYGLTESEAKTFDVSDVFRLSYTWKSTVAGSDEPAAGAQALLAKPELYCAS